MSYIVLALAIGAEIGATMFLKMSEGFSKLVPSLACVVSYVLCYFCFSKAVLKINLGTAYATWCGVGIVATTVISVLVFQEKITMAGVAGVVMILAGCVILNLFGTRIS